MMFLRATLVRADATRRAHQLIGYRQSLNAVPSPCILVKYCTWGHFPKLSNCDQTAYG